MIIKALLFGLGFAIGIIVICLIRKKTRKATIEFLGTLILLLFLVLMSPSMLVGFLVNLSKVGYDTGHRMYDYITDLITKDIQEEQNENRVENNHGM